MFNMEQNDLLFAPVTEEELLFIMKSFQKDKSSGLDSWTIDFFIHFFDIKKSDLLNMVEESRTMGSIPHLITSTYITLIPKKKPTLSFRDYRPISLCNTIYKIISKIIAVRMREILSMHISLDQHGFLKDRNIIEAVAITQEGLHFMHMRKMEAAFLKIDLKKSYDCTGWGFLRCLLIKIDININYLNWIMACVIDVKFVVLVNGIPTSFFQAARGL